MSLSPFIRLIGGFYGLFSFYSMYCIQHCFHLPPIRFHCVGGCWDRTQDCCDFGIESDALTTRLDLIHIQIDLIHPRLDLINTRLDRIHPFIQLVLYPFYHNVNSFLQFLTASPQIVSSFKKKLKIF
jgi:hypothetical protein